MDEQNNNFKNFFNQIDDFLFVVDFNGNIVEINNSVTSVLGYTKEELLGQSILKVYPPELSDEGKNVNINRMINLSCDICLKNFLNEENKPTSSDIRKHVKALNFKCDNCVLPLITKDHIITPVETVVYPGTWNSQEVLFRVSRNFSDLAFSEEKFYKIFNNGQAFMVITDIDTGEFLNVNKNFLQLFGYTKNEVIGRNVRDINLYYDFNMRLEFIKKINNNENIDNFEVDFRTKNNERLHCLFSMSKIQIQSQAYLFSSGINVTHLKTVENKLKDNLNQQTLLADISKKLISIDNIEQEIEDSLKLLGEHSNISRAYIYQFNAENKTYSNTYEWCNTGIVPQKNFLQKKPCEAFPLWQKILEEQGKILSNNINELPEEIVQLLEPKTIKSILVFPLYAFNRFWGFIGFNECSVNRAWEQDEIELFRTIANIISNTFERIISQKQLSDSETQLKMAIENTEAGLWDWNISTDKLYINDVWCKMIGYDKSEIEPIIQSWEKRVHPEDITNVKNEINKHLSGETAKYQSIHRFQTKSGDWIWVYDKGKVIEYDEAGKPMRMIGTHIDISHQKEIENELRISNATKDNLFSIIAHDLRGPMGNLMNIADLLSNDNKMDEESQIFFLKSQQELTKSTYQLLENLLNWARYNRNQIEYKPQSFYLCNIINETITNVQFQASNKEIEVSTNCPDIFTVFADIDMVKLILRNLLTNALKFTPSKGIIYIDVSENIISTIIKVKDTGIGIPHEDFGKILSEDKIFTTYGTDREKGSGLGLKLCKNFVTLNHGKFYIESELGKGTTFTFTLPREEKKWNND